MGHVHHLIPSSFSSLPPKIHVSAKCEESLKGVQSITSMVKNYYEVLGIKRDAPEEDIANAYKKLALRWHPHFSKDDPNTTNYHFSQISEAYQVLSDQVKRAFYDKYGEKKLKEGFFAEGELKGGYRFADNAQQIFEKFFTDNNIFAKVFDKGIDSQGSMFGYAFGGQNYQETKTLKDLEVEIECSLAQLYNGCSYPVKFQRTVVNLDGRTTSQVELTKIIEIHPGSSKDSVIEYENEGNETPGDRKKSKLIFKIIEQLHSKYKRAGNDLIYTAEITLLQALNSDSVQVTTLDNRKLLISFDQIINPKTVKEIEGEGMPVEQKGFVKAETYGSPHPQGNLYIKFNISFPVRVSEENKLRLRRLFPEG